MKSRLLGWVAALGLTAFSVCGCSTTWSVASGVREPYSGTKLDNFIFNSSDSSVLEKTGAFLDFPFSFTADIVLVVFMQPAGAENLINPEFQ